MMRQTAKVLEVEGISVRYPGVDKAAIKNVSLALPAQHTLGIVGESGSGKSTLCLALLGLLPQGTIVDGSIRFNGRELNRLPQRELRKVRGGDIGLIYQDPMAALNPVRTIGAQMREPLVLHKGLSKRAADQESIQLLDLVGIPNPASKLRMYPFELSGGMRQRVVIAMAVSCRPSLVIADEPTTALDVTVQAQVLELLSSLKKELSLTLLFISHDLSVVASVSDHILVMRDGDPLEQGPAADVLKNPTASYTRELIESLLTLEGVTPHEVRGEKSR